jgi:hypothetical protein
MAGALAPLMLATIVVPSHLRHKGSEGVKIRGEEGRYCYDSLKIENGKVGGPTPPTLLLIP